MKKIIYILSAVAVSLVLFSCKSSKEVVEADGVVITSAEEEAKAAKAKAEEEKRIAAEEEAKKKANYMGWIGATVKNPVYRDGLVDIQTDSGRGSIYISAVDNENKLHSIFSTLNEGASTGFSLKAGRKIYRLISDKNVKVAAGELESGVSMAYIVKDVANVIVNMDVFPSIVNKPADTIQFTVNVKNIGKKTESFALKAILDTVLGEVADSHFYNYEGDPIRSEYSTRRMSEDKWFISKNSRASMQLLLNGGNCTNPEFVALSSYTALDNAVWEPNIQSSRAFDTVLSYNNSAIGIFWPTKRLAPEESYNVVFYISLALDEKTPNGYKYVYGIEVEEEPVVPEEEFVTPSRVKKEPKKETKTVVAEPTKVVPEPTKVVPETEQLPAKKSNIVDMGVTEKTIVTPETKNSKEAVKIVEEKAQKPAEQPVVVKKPREEKTVEKEAVKEQPVVQQPVVEKTETVKVEEIAATEEDKEKINPNVEFNVKNIPQSHLTMEYVQNLMNRIDELEKSKNPDRNEILLLGKELDAILNILRQ